MKAELRRFGYAILFVIALALASAFLLRETVTPMSVVGAQSLQQREVMGTEADGATSTGGPVIVGGVDAGGLAQSLRVGTSGELAVDAYITNTVTITDGGTTTPIRIHDNDTTISVDDGAGTLTVDGAVSLGTGYNYVGQVAITQSLPTGYNYIGQVAITQELATGFNHIGNTSVTNTVTITDGGAATPLRVSDNGESLTVDGTITSTPMSALLETGVVEIIGVDEQAAQYDWSDGTAVALGGTYSGEILNVTLILSGSLSEAGTLIIFDADPSVTLADANLATASWLLSIGKVDVAAGDWFEENAGGTGGMAHFAVPIAFHELSSLWVAFYHEGATQWNSLAADNETLDIQIEFRRDS